MQRVFEALGSAVRRDILAHLATGEMAAGEIAAKFDISKPAVSQHLSVLDAAGLVTSRKKGQFVYYRLVREAAEAPLRAFLEQLAAAPPPEEAAAPPAPKPPEPPPREPGVPVVEGGPGVGYRWEAWRA